MGKKILKETQEFTDLQKELLRLKDLYYNQSISEVTDREYDILERKSFTLAEEIGYRADSWGDFEENESHHVHWMVGYDKTNLYNNLPTDINGKEVKIGDKVRGFGYIKFQDGFKIDRTPTVTVNVQNKILYFGQLPAQSFDKFEILE